MWRTSKHGKGERGKKGEEIGERRKGTPPPPSLRLPSPFRALLPSSPFLRLSRRLTLFYNSTFDSCHLNTAISGKVVGKNVHATNPKGNMGYDQYIVPDDCSCRTYFCCFPLALANTFPWPLVPILSNFFGKKRTQNHPQCRSGLSRALFPTTFLEIAVSLSRQDKTRQEDLFHSARFYIWSKRQINTFI